MKNLGQFAVLSVVLISNILVSGCAQTNKSVYRCELDDPNCGMNLLKMCSDSILLDKTKGFTIKYDITKLQDSCHIVLSLEDIEDKTVSGLLKGKTMDCIILLKDTPDVFKTFSVDFFRYCNGELKDIFAKYNFGFS